MENKALQSADRLGCSLRRNVFLGMVKVVSLAMSSDGNNTIFRLF
jgi:hypothetical protein